jgi:hypothetical protein
LLCVLVFALLCFFELPFMLVFFLFSGSVPTLSGL